jgi:hypothetical protein
LLLICVITEDLCVIFSVEVVLIAESELATGCPGAIAGSSAGGQIRGRNMSREVRSGLQAAEKRRFVSLSEGSKG